MAKQVFLDFEKQIEELQSKIDELNEMQEKDEGKKIDLSSEIDILLFLNKNDTQIPYTAALLYLSIFSSWYFF